MGPVVAILGFFAMLAWIVWVVVDGRRRAERLKITSEFQGKLLDRLGSAQELGEFLDSRGGIRFLDALTVDRGGPLNRILRDTQTGIVFCFVGVAFAAISRFADEGLRGPLAAFGVLFVMLGLGYLVSCAVSWRLSKRLGLAPGRTESEPRGSTAP